MLDKGSLEIEYFGKLSFCYSIPLDFSFFLFFLFGIHGRGCIAYVFVFVFFFVRFHMGRGVGGEGWDPYLDCIKMENTRIKPP